MAAIRHLGHAPITEALVDFRATVAPDFEVARFADLRVPLADQYPISAPQHHLQASVAFNAAEPSTIASAAPTVLRGFMFSSADRKSLAQFRRDGFTFNRLAPYTGWEAIRPEALRLWGLYVEWARPSACDRLALRYINHIHVPIPGARLEDYLTGPPRVPERAAGDIAEFFSRVVIRDDDNQWSAIVTQASQAGPTAQAATIVVDVDAFREFQGQPPDERALQATLTSLHDLKNQLFFGSITERTAEEYQ